MQGRFDKRPCIVSVLRLCEDKDSSRLVGFYVAGGNHIRWYCFGVYLFLAGVLCLIYVCAGGRPYSFSRVMTVCDYGIRVDIEGEICVFKERVKLPE